MDAYFLGSPQSGKKTEVWPLFSLEYPLLDQLFCLVPPRQIPCNHQFLGLALEPETVCIDSAGGANLCQDSPDSDPVWVWAGCGMNLSYRDVEKMWLDGLIYAADTVGMCDHGIEYWNEDWFINPNCISSNNSDLFFGAQVSPSFVKNYFQNLYDSIADTYSMNISPFNWIQNPTGNVYGGFMYYTYSIQDCKPNYRKMSSEPENTYLLSEAFLSRQGEALHLNTSSWMHEILNWKLIDGYGRVIKQGTANSSSGYLDVSTYGLAGGMYYVQISPQDCWNRGVVRVFVQ